MIDKLAKNIYFDESVLPEVTWVRDEDNYSPFKSSYPENDPNNSFALDLFSETAVVFSPDYCHEAEPFLVSGKLIDSTDKMVELIEEHLEDIERVALRVIYSTMFVLEQHEQDLNDEVKDDMELLQTQLEDMETFDTLSLSDRLKLVLENPQEYLLNRNVAELYLIQSELTEEYADLEFEDQVDA